MPTEVLEVVVGKPAVAPGGEVAVDQEIPFIWANEADIRKIDGAVGCALVGNDKDQGSGVVPSRYCPRFDLQPSVHLPITLILRGNGDAELPGLRLPATHR